MSPLERNPWKPLSAGVGSRNEQTRTHNLSTILTLTHHAGHLSRSDLTRRTGLNRSTIGALVSELAERELAHEVKASDAGTVGRPSPQVVANAKVVAFAVNPDIDAVTIGVVGLGGVVHQSVRVDVPDIPSAADVVDITARTISDLRASLSDDVRVVGVGLAVPGLVRTSDGLVTNATNLGWKDEPLTEAVSSATGLPTYADNDGNVGVISEAIFGAGRASDNFVFLDGLPSGVGGGALINGTPLRGSLGYGSELGHLLVNSDGTLCHCGRRGCLETELGLRKFRHAAGLASLTVPEFDELLSTNTSPGLQQEVDRQSEVLAGALSSFVTILNPDLIVLGGFLGSLLSARGERLISRVKELSFAPIGEHVSIERASARDRTVLVGAAELAFQPLLHNPTAFKWSK